MAAKPDFGTIVATTGQAAEHIAVACEYGAWKIAVMEQSPGVLRAVVGWGEAGRETEPGDEPGKYRSMPHSVTGRHCGLSLCRRTRTLGELGFWAQRVAPLGGEIVDGESRAWVLHALKSWPKAGLAPRVNLVVKKTYT